MFSTYSQALAVSNVPDEKERSFQKERLLENVHNSIKQVQNEASELNNISTPLRIQDLPVQQLCQQLDLVFLHGLRHIANGYWFFVREFTLKASVSSILSLKNVHTHVGRGRAWLYSALNENSLENYIRSFSTNPVLIDQYYIQQAFLRDEQRLQTLYSVVAGLEFIPFQLELDLPFLDESIIPINMDESLILRKESSLSSISLTSSFLSQSNKLSREIYWTYLNCKHYLSAKLKQSTTSLESLATSHDGDSGFGTMENSQLNGTENGSLTLLQKSPFKMDERIARILGMDFTNHQSAEKGEDGLESVQVVTRSGKKRKPKKVNNTINGETSPSIIIMEPLVNGYKKPEELASSTEVTPTETSNGHWNIKIHDNNGDDDDDDKKNIENNKGIKCQARETTTEVKSAIKLRDKSGERKNPAKRVSFEIDLVANDVNMNYYSNGQPETTQINGECNVENVNGESSPPEKVEIAEPADEEDFGSIYDRNYSPAVFRRSKSKKNKSSGFKGLTLKLDELDFSKQSQKFDETMKAEMLKKEEREEMNSIKVDNNTMLKLMFSVFREDDERLFKMFYATIGHSEDKIKLVFLVLTDRKLYLIEHGLCQRHYFISKVIDYEEMDYLLLGLNYQTILLVCKRRRKRYMLCTGNETLTRSIVSNLEVAVRRRCGCKQIPSVFTDSPMQTIGIKKWIAKETNIEREDVQILHYALIHWEDPQSPDSPQCPAGPSKDGHLMFKYHYTEEITTSLMETSWTPGYFVLRAGVLYQFNDKDSHELKMYMRLHSPDFRGCRRVHSPKRPHVFELRLDVGKFMHLAAANDYEASQWMQAFLETISYKAMDENPRVFKACSLVLTHEKLLVCEEDLELFTCVTLGCAHLKDMNKIQVDPQEPSYCVLEFETLEANVCSGDWILYFSSESEMDKFFIALDKAWQEIFQIPVGKKEIENDTILHKCRDRVQVLRTSWKLGFDMLSEPIAVIENYASPQ